MATIAANTTSISNSMVSAANKIVAERALNLKKANNLSDVADANTARNNLQAAKAATVSTADPSGGSTGDVWYKVPA